MKIETKVNFKLRKGGILPAGKYDDAKKPFPEEIYEEIEKNRGEKRSRWTLKILDDSSESSTEELNTMDTGEDTVETKKKTRRKRKKT